MDLGVFYEVIVPLMEVEGTATICISTPLDPNNFYSVLTELKDDKDRLVFNVRHIEGNHPVPWKTSEGRSKVQAIYASNTLMFEREIMGKIVGDGENAAFNAERLKRMFDQPRATPPYVIDDRTIYVSIDPNGGATATNGPGSETAIVSFFVSECKVVIVGLDAHATHSPEQPRQMLYKHLDMLRAQPCFAHCKIMLVPEANYGDQAQLLAQIMLRRSQLGWCDVEILCQYGHSYGVFTSPGDPARYVHRMREKLAENGFVLHDNLVCANPYSDKRPADLVAHTLREFRRQMGAFRQVYVVPKTLQSRVRVIYSGKLGKDGKRSSQAKDDMCMALLFGYFYYKQFMSEIPLVSTRDSTSMLHIDRDANRIHSMRKRQSSAAPAVQTDKRQKDDDEE